MKRLVLTKCRTISALLLFIGISAGKLAPATLLILMHGKPLKDFHFHFSIYAQKKEVTMYLLLSKIKDLQKYIFSSPEPKAHR